MSTLKQEIEQRAQWALQFYTGNSGIYLENLKKLVELLKRIE